MGYSFRLAARVLLYVSSHRQDSTRHGLCYTSRGTLAGTRNSSMGPPHEGSIQRPIAPWVKTGCFIFILLTNKCSFLAFWQCILIDTPLQQHQHAANRSWMRCSSANSNNVDHAQHAQSPHVQRLRQQSQPSLPVQQQLQQLQHELRNNQCVVCGAHAIFLCACCKRVWYCSKSCQVGTSLYFYARYSGDGTGYRLIEVLQWESLIFLFNPMFCFVPSQLTLHVWYIRGKKEVAVSRTMQNRRMFK